MLTGETGSALHVQFDQDLTRPRIGNHLSNFQRSASPPGIPQKAIGGSSHSALSSPLFASTTSQLPRSSIPPFLVTAHSIGRLIKTASS